MSWQRILEYLGGIETTLSLFAIYFYLLILEYLGGIETFFIVAYVLALLFDFRIPRRDWNP